MKLPKILEAQLKKLGSATSTCKVCFNKIDFGLNNIICDKCFNDLDCIYDNFTISNVEVLCIYNYDDAFRNLLYRYKGCFDYELKDVFLTRQKRYLQIKYFNYTLVPIPSWEEDDIIRGFNHVEEICRSLDMQVIKCLRKKCKFKQSSLLKSERQNVENKIVVTNGELIKGKNILLVDDVLTTGSTVKAAINLLSNYNPKNIKVLILSRKCRKIKK